MCQRLGAAALCEWPDASTPSASKSLPQASNVAVKESDWVKEVTTSEMGRAEEIDCESEVSNVEINLNNSQPTQTSEAVIEGDSAPPFTPPPNEIILKVCDGNQSDTPSSPDCGTTDSVRIHPSRSPMLIDSPTNTEATHDPLPVLGLEMEVDNYFGLYNFKPENDNQNTSRSGSIFWCDKCGYTAPGEQDLNSHNEIMHGSPNCGTCVPLCWGSCGREVQIAQTTTSQSLNNGQGNTESLPGSRGPQTDTNEKPPSVDCRILKY